MLLFVVPGFRCSDLYSEKGGGWGGGDDVKVEREGFGYLSAVPFCIMCRTKSFTGPGGAGARGVVVCVFLLLVCSWLLCALPCTPYLVHLDLDVVVP